VGATCQSNIHMDAGPKVSQQNIAQSMTLPPPVAACPVAFNKDGKSVKSLFYPHSVHSDNAACRPKKPNLKSTGDHVAQDSPYVSLRGTASPDSKAQRNEKAHYLLKAISQRSEEADQIFIKFFNKMFELSVIESKIDNFQHRFHDVV
ncbi:hypothetical protein QTP86_034691, partial [Hemibagrus guttatus]